MLNIGGIENPFHRWFLDEIFDADSSRIRPGHSAHNISLMRNFSLNLLRQETDKKNLQTLLYCYGQ